jgi:hypothetical protein
MKIILSGHRLPAGTFDTLKDAFPWKYKKAGDIEWLELFEQDGVAIQVFKTRDNA